jgi:hypothetical protein
MSSNIDITKINENYPIPGQDNTSQGFRDNFTAIKDNFSTTSQEITDLLLNTARTDSTTDFNSSTAKDINLEGATLTVYDHGNVDQDLEIDFTNGQFQTVTVTDNIGITIVNWPSVERYAYMRCAIRSDGVQRTITWAETATQTFQYGINWPVNFTVSSSNNYTLVDLFTFDGGETIHLKFAGRFLDEAIDEPAVFTNLTVTNDAEVNGDLTVRGSLNFEQQDLFQDSDAEVFGDLNVNGKIFIFANPFVNLVDDTNIGIGNRSLDNLTSGQNNIALGNGSLLSLTSGSNNTVVGRNAGSSIDTGINNVVLGNRADVSDPDVNNEIVIGNLSNQNFRLPGLGIDLTPTGALKLPSGTSAERPGNSTEGSIRYNTEKDLFEGNVGSEWARLGSIQDDDQDTFILPEQENGSDEDTLYFFNQNSLSATLSEDRLALSQGIRLSVASQATANSLGSGAVIVDGGVSIAGNLVVGGNIVNAGLQTTSSISAEASAVTGQSTNTLNLVDLNKIDSFLEERFVRLYNASLTPDSQTTLDLSLSLARVGFSTPQATDTTIEFSYQLAQFDFDTGKISPAITPTTIDIVDSEILFFNNTNNIQLTFDRESAQKGVLIYRKIGNQTSHRLIYVLGPKEMGTSTRSIQFTDYYDYDRTPWSGKDATNSYSASTGLVHFPLTAPGDSVYGFLDTKITSIDRLNGAITVEDSFVTTGNVQVFNDETEIIQDQINLNAAAGILNLELDTRTYFIRSLVLPNGFSLTGNGEQTRLVKLPWSTDRFSNSNEVIRLDPSINDVEQMVLRDIAIDGNAQNQYLLDDSVDEFVNYAITVYGDSLNVSSVNVINVIGGGLYLYNREQNTSSVFVTQNKINNGSLTYRYDYSPLVAKESSDISIIQNNFTNFPEYVDASSITRGVVTSNIISNCGSGLLGFGVINTILNPNVLVGPAGEYLPAPDQLNSEYDSVNITIEPGTDYVSPQLRYQETGENFDLTANEGELSSAINELRKINGVEVISTDYTQTTGGTDYISFVGGLEADQGEFQFRIQESFVNDLLSRANYETLFNNNTSTEGLVYRIFQTEFVPQTEITGPGTDLGSNIYRVPVDDTGPFVVNDVVRLQGHNTTPDSAGQNGIITNINTIQKLIEIEIDLGGSITPPPGTEPDFGNLALKNTFVIVKGQIN